MLPILAYIIKLLKITKTGLLMYVYFLWYVFLCFNTHLTSSLNLADLPFFIYNPSHNNFYNFYFLYEYAFFEF